MRRRDRADRFLGRGPVTRAVGALILAGAGVFVLTSAAAAQASRTVLRSEVVGPITPVVADQIADGVQRSVAEGHELYLIELDTPGGLDVSMRDIVQSLVGSDVPTVVYVSPTGARAASAGAVITLGSHVAAMAPGTTTGAATPVALEGEEISDKILNDAVSYVRALAELRDRPVDLAVDMVREGTSVTASEALGRGFVEVVAADRDELLSAIDGRSVTLDDERTVTLRTADASVVDFEMDLGRRVLQWLADPNLAFLFISLGTLAIIYELANPGVGLGGIVGVILLLLAFASLAVLPATAVGIVLLLLAAGLFVAELFVPGVGVFAVGGAIALVLAGAFLFRGPIGVDAPVLWPTAIVVGGGAIIAGRLAWRARNAPPRVGETALVGHVGTIRTATGTTGQAFVDGALWNARADAPLHEGQHVRVVDVDGLDLIVVPGTDAPEPANR